MDKWNKNLITFQRGIIVSVILGTDDTILRGVEIYRVSRQIRVLVIRPGEEESRVLTRCDAEYPVGRDFHHHNRNRLRLQHGGVMDTQHRYRVDANHASGRTPKQRRKKVFITLVKHQSNRRRVGESHSKLRTGKCIEKKKKRRKLTHILRCQSTADGESVSWRFEVLRGPIRAHLVCPDGR